MIFLDTHVWLWRVSRPEKLSSTAHTEVDGAAEIGISSISSWEVATLVRLGRIELDRPVADWIGQALSHPRVRDVPVTSSVASRAGGLELVHGDQADRLIYATALEFRAPLLSRDEALRRLDPVRVIWWRG